MNARIMLAVLQVNITLLMVFVIPVGTVDASLDGYYHQGISGSGPAVNTDQQTWILHSKAVSGGYVMDQANLIGNNGPDKEIAIAGGSQALWIADQAQRDDTSYSSGVWHVDLMTAIDWGTAGNMCQVDVGTWNRIAFEKFEMSTNSSNYFSSYPSFVLRQSKSQKKPYIVHSGEYLALQITNTDVVAHTIYTAENKNGSFISGIYGGTISQITQDSSPTVTPASSSPVPSASASSPTASPPLAEVVIVNTTLQAAQNAVEKKKSSTPIPSQNAKPENESSLAGGILGALIAVAITVGLFVSIIIVNKIIVKRRARGSK